MKIVPEKAGKEIDVEASKRAVMDGVTLGDSTVSWSPARSSRRPTRRCHKVILVRAGENKLYLYENGQIVKQWPVATGAKGYLTPEGRAPDHPEDREPVVAQPGQRLGPGPAQRSSAPAPTTPWAPRPSGSTPRPSSSTPPPTAGRSATASPTAASA